MNIFTLLRRPSVAYGMAAILLFMGRFALFTYLRPFLEAVTKVERVSPVTDAVGNGCHRAGWDVSGQFDADHGSTSC